MQTTGDMMRQFDISRQTVSNWCHTFARFLSPTANPPVGAQRRFSDDDLRVFAVIHRQKRAGLTFDEISAALASGERDEPPADMVAATNGAVERLQQRIIALESQLRDSERREAEKDGKVDELRRQLTDAHTRIDALNREIGRLMR